MRKRNFRQVLHVVERDLSRRRIMRRFNLLMFAAVTFMMYAPCLQGQGGITSFDPPDAGTGSFEGTFPQQITAAGTIVGYYRDSNFMNHGFVRSVQGQFTTIDVPGAGPQGTRAWGITQARVVGDYRDINRVSHGFVRGPDGTITTFDVPGAGSNRGQGTFPAAINAGGTISGNYLDADGVGHGFVRAGDGTITSFDPEGSAYTDRDTEGINSAGTIAVPYFDSNVVWHGAVRAADGTITIFDVPG